MGSDQGVDGTPAGLLGRVLKLFGDVRAEEATNMVAMFCNVFLLLSAYYILKTVREGLIIAGGGLLGLEGDELKIYAAAGMAFLLLLVIPAYGALASKLDRIRLLNTTGAAVIGSLGVFFVLGSLNVNVAVAFFLWLGIVSVFLVSQFWSYANDIYSDEQGKRLFPVIAVGGSLGSIIGPRVAHVGRQHTFVLMLVAAGMFAVCVLLYNLVNRRQARAASRRAEVGEEKQSTEEKPLGKEGGFQLVFRQRYLLYIAGVVLISNLVNTTGEFILSNAAKTHATAKVPDDAHSEIADPKAREKVIKDERTGIITGFYGSFFFWVNFVGFLLQAFAVSRIFKFAGVRFALFVLPAVAGGAYTLIGIVGGLTLLRIAKTAENSIDYSLQNTVWQALYLPTSREVKYKAKATIDTFFRRIGDAVAAAVVAFGIHWLAFSPRHFAFVNIGLTLAWVLVALGIASRHRALTGAGPASVGN